MIMVNRLVSFAQKNKTEWATPKFRILHGIGMYQIKEIETIHESDPKYELIRFIDGTGVSVKHMKRSNDRCELARLAEDDLFNLICEHGYETVGLGYTAEVMVRLVRTIDKAIALKTIEDDTNDIYDYAKLREKVVFFIRTQFGIEFYYRGFVSTLIKIVKTNKLIQQTLHSISDSVLILTRQELEQLTNRRSNDLLHIVYELVSIERNIHKIETSK